MKRGANSAPIPYARRTTPPTIISGDLVSAILPGYTPTRRAAILIAAAVSSVLLSKPGDEEAVAKVELDTIEDVVVSLLPHAALQVPRQLDEPAEERVGSGQVAFPRRSATRMAPFTKPLLVPAASFALPAKG